MKNYKILLPILIIMINYSISMGQNTPFEQSGGTESATYEEIIKHYKLLAQAHKELSFIEVGMSDAGKPIHLAILSSEPVKELKEIQSANKPVIFINNGIHPGEPCGIDACMLYTKNLLAGEDQKALLNDIIICIIPVYNVGGCLNRNNTTRANQNGPKEYGFRGNAKNFDLNRDFIKCDSKNSKTFNRVYSSLNPHLFIDTHTTNGADYPSTMTLISTQKDKLHHLLAHYLITEIEPFLYEQMNNTQYKMCPYVNHGGKGIENGISAFLDLPRYSSGYTALGNTIGFITEAHMLKPYFERVMSTYQFIELLTLFAQNNAQTLLELKIQADEETMAQTNFDLQWELNKEENTSLNFEGFESSKKISGVTGKEVTIYNNKKPYKKSIPFYKNYNVVKNVKKPWAYLIPIGWTDIIDRMNLNNVTVNRINQDTIIELPVTYISSYETLDWAFEGHYLHYGTSSTKKQMKAQLNKGDYIIICNQIKNRYIVETLEPEGPDSFFNWNFFDSILMQKEYFSDYLFDVTAEKLLLENEALKSEFEAMKTKDKSFANNSRAQLDFIYKRSPHYEKNHLRYPVLRIESEIPELIN